MDDILAKLRERIEATEGIFNSISVPVTTLQDAVREIERLRADLEHWKEAYWTCLDRSKPSRKTGD